MLVVSLILLLLAAVCFLAAFSNKFASKFNLLIALGLFCWVTNDLIHVLAKAAQSGI